MLNRRKFIRNATMAAGSFFLPPFHADAEEGMQRLVILHTNDTHSRLEPFPMDGSKYQGMGGVAARAQLIQEIRKQEEHVLLLDAGDIFQGTPYFNLYKGEPEMKAMAWMQYDACTMGNHDFDGGMDVFANQLKHVQFPVLVSNYDFTETPLDGKVLPYHVIRKGRLRIGITGVGIQLSGLVPENLYGKTQYMDPVLALNRTADRLKNELDCDLVICLSHLGHDYPKEPDRISDLKLARASQHVDIIIGGHTHTFLNEPVLIPNEKGRRVIINQVGWGGLVLGRMDLEFVAGKASLQPASGPVLIGKKTRE